mmetsp:Transcript_35539/g.41135  ORF Transcript_35539/g.41135 Transcript_35539/m.41135 type:complete len:81 (-) Transcript_35539:96-338(-)
MNKADNKTPSICSVSISKPTQTLGSTVRSEKLCMSYLRSNKTIQESLKDKKSYKKNAELTNANAQSVKNAHKSFDTRVDH